MAITPALTEMLAANARNADSVKRPVKIMDISKAANAAEPQGVIVITCADPRLFPEQILGLDGSQPTKRGVVVRNAGGRVFDALRSVAVLQRLGNAGTIVVMHHVDCGMLHIKDEDIKKYVYSISPDAGEEIESVKRYGEIAGTVEESIKEDLALLGDSAFVRKGTAIVGLNFDPFTGTVTEVESRTR